MATTVSTYVAEVERNGSGNWIAGVPALRGLHTMRARWRVCAATCGTQSRSGSRSA
jgi:hypothetical protein